LTYNWRTYFSSKTGVDRIKTALVQIENRNAELDSCDFFGVL
jgi:hypothetical protein